MPQSVSKRGRQMALLCVRVPARVCVWVATQLQLPSIIRHAKCQIIYLLYVQLTKADWTPNTHTHTHTETNIHIGGGICIPSPE